MIHVISLGAGVQSSTMALMAAHGEIEPMPIGAVFADTMAEPENVYRWLDWLETKLPFPVWRVTTGNLGEEGLELRTSKKTGYNYQRTLVPFFLAKTGGGKGMLPRKCTKDFKIDALVRKGRELAGVKISRKDTPVKLIQWIGISIDEAHRMKPAQHTFIQHRWPLIDAGMSREDCLQWMESLGYPKPPRSACVFCPYHSDGEWLRLKTEEPKEFQKAVDWEKQQQAVAATQSEQLIKGVPFLHSSCQPLDLVQLTSGANEKQFGNECEGMCGV